MSNPHYKRMVVPRSRRAATLQASLRATLAGRTSQVLELAAFAKLDSASVAAEAKDIPAATIREELQAGARELLDAYREIFEVCARAEAAGINVASFLAEVKLMANASPSDL